MGRPGAQTEVAPATGLVRQGALRTSAGASERTTAVAALTSSPPFFEGGEDVKAATAVVRSEAPAEVRSAPWRTSPVAGATSVCAPGRPITCRATRHSAPRLPHAPKMGGISHLFSPQNAGALAPSDSHLR